MSLLLGGSVAVAIGDGHRFKVARLTAIYVLGVATIVLPITLGAAALASYVTKWHPQLFTIGGLMMIGVAVMLWRGSMLHINVPQPKLGGSAFSVFGLGLFSGAATACCAPVLAGAIALSATSGTIFGGLLLGVAYVAGTIVPLIPVAFAYKRAKRSMRDPQVTLRLGSRVKRIGVVRLLGTSVFAGFGVLFIALALTGASNSAPGFQKVLGSWMREVGVYVGHVPNFVSAPLLLAAVGGFIYAVLKKGSRNHERQEVQSSPAPECHSAEIKPRP